MFLTKNEAKDALLKLDWAEDDIDNYMAGVDHPKAERQDDKIAFPQLIIEQRCVVMDGKREARRCFPRHSLRDVFTGRRSEACNRDDRAVAHGVSRHEVFRPDKRVHRPD